MIRPATALYALHVISKMHYLLIRCASGYNRIASTNQNKRLQNNNSIRIVARKYYDCCLIRTFLCLYRQKAICTLIGPNQPCQSPTMPYNQQNLVSANQRFEPPADIFPKYVFFNLCPGQFQTFVLCYTKYVSQKRKIMHIFFLVISTVNNST